MFELKIALQYLLPKKKSLTSALVSLMSILVISLVVWLVLVFLSVTSGIERNWIKKLTSTHAPIRISPTNQYFNSYYYLIDALSADSGYCYKSIAQKAIAEKSDPYNPELDREIPPFINKPDVDQNGNLKDPVKELFSILNQTKDQSCDFSFQDYELSGALMRLGIQNGTSVLSQMTFLISIPFNNPQLKSLILPVENNLTASSKTLSEEPCFAYFEENTFHLPNFAKSTPVILPKNYKESGAKIGDSGSFVYTGLTAGSTQERRTSFKVAGFYDPGIMAVGNKCILVPQEVIQEINAANICFSPDGTPSNGVFVWFDNLTKTNQIANEIQTALQEHGIQNYWQVTSYENYEFAKDLFNQFKSDKTLLLLIGAIILFVACSNIISLLVILVNDKKKEIAILQAMGASFKSIATIFGFCGMVMGFISCFIGTTLAILTLKNIDSIVSFLSMVQGRAAFNPNFFGNSLPNALSLEALWFVLIATPLISLLAGLIPALKASSIQTSNALRAQ